MIAPIVLVAVLIGAVTVVAHSADFASAASRPLSGVSGQGDTNQGATNQGDTNQGASGEIDLGRGGLEPQKRAPMSIDEIRESLAEDASKPIFNGTLLGWRLAPDDVLDAEGVGDRNLHRPCEARLAGDETATQLDFALGYFPESLTIEHVAGPEKWVCDDDGLSVMHVYNLDTPMGSGDLFVFRALWGRRSLDLHAPEDRVETGTINGRPAILVHAANDEFGLGVGQVIVFEDNTEPEFTILRVYYDNGIPFQELVKIAEGIR